jgi:NADPH-dependent glutamate synthase beta subunit-like oxidoreductase
MVEVPGTEQDYKADLVLLAMGFVNPVATVLDSLWRRQGRRGNAKATTDAIGGYAPTCPRCSPPATCAAARAWWCGPSAKAARPHARWTSS